jgi:hypothetical protein
MSLIQEALEKAGRSVEETPVTPRVADAVPVRRNSQVPILVFGILIFLGGLIAYHFLTSWAQHSSPTKDGGKALRSSVEARMSSIVPNLTPQGKFTLTGITISGDQRLALINDQVVAVGDRVGENTFVKEIQERRVILEFQGREVKLAL